MGHKREREHEVSVYDLAVRPKLEAGMVHTFEKDCKNFERRKSQTTEVVTWILPQPKLHLGPHSRLQPPFYSSPLRLIEVINTAWIVNMST